MGFSSCLGGYSLGAGWEKAVQSSQLVLQEAGAECNFCSLESFRCEPEKMSSFPFLLYLSFSVVVLTSCFENPGCSSINIQSPLLPKRMMICLLEWAVTALCFHLAWLKGALREFYCSNNNCGSNYTGTGTGRAAGSITCQMKEELPYRRLFKHSWTIRFF